jgi:hypothetical protein
MCDGSRKLLQHRKRIHHEDSIATVKAKTARRVVVASKYRCAKTNTAQQVQLEHTNQKFHEMMVYSFCFRARRVISDA